MESKNLMRVRFHTKKGYSDGGQGIYSRESIVPEGRKEKYKAPKSCARQSLLPIKPRPIVDQDSIYYTVAAQGLPQQSGKSNGVDK